MADNDSAIAGLPIEVLIGAPIQAAAKASLMLAKTTADYIETVGFTPSTTDAEGNTMPGTTRNVDFRFERPNQDETTGEVIIEELHVRVPLLAIVPVPILQIEQMNVTFDLEIVSSSREESVEKTSDSTEKQQTNEEDLGTEDVILHGKTSTHREHTRQTDKSSKYHFEITAVDQGVPETLARIIDMMAASVAPRSINVRE